MKKLQRFKFYLFEFCRKLAEREACRDELAHQAKKLAEREGIDYKVALLRLAEERPWLVEDLPLSLGAFADPRVYLDSWAESFRAQVKSRAGREIPYAEALSRARERFPTIAALSDLIHSDWDLFKRACIRVGHLDPDYARERVEELILAEAERLREEA